MVPEEAGKAREAVAELLHTLVSRNGIRPGELAAAVFTLPPELGELRAAAVAREMGWERVPLLEVSQPARADDIPRCLRVLLLWNADVGQEDVRHVYLGRAASLRPDLAARDGGEER